MFLRFADPHYLWLLLLLPLLYLWYLKRHAAGAATASFPHVGSLKMAHRPSAVRARHLLFALRLLALAALIVVSARPQSGAAQEELLTEGIDMILALDLSSSMLAEDIEPNRVEASKQVAADFIRQRKNDRMGLVVFAARGYTQCPLTLDYGVLLNFLEELRVGVIDDGTAIGMGIAAGVNRLRDSKAKSKVMILLTDGRNNRGEVDPITAAQMAEALGIRIYSIGAGAKGVARYPVQDPLLGKRYAQIRVDIDEDTLKKVADLTGGRYFRATDRQSLEETYAEIDRLEKTEIEVKEYTRYGELFGYPLVLAAVLLLGEIGLANTRFRKIP